MSVIERAAAIAYEYKHGEPPPTDSPHGPIGPAWDCWKAAEAILALADDAGAVKALRPWLKHHPACHMAVAEPCSCGLDDALATTGGQ